VAKRKLESVNIQDVVGEISIILPVYKNQESALRTLSALLAITGPTRDLIIIDSSPQPIEATQFGQIGVRYRHLPNRLFAGNARNIGADQSNREWLYFLDSDCLPHPDFFVRLKKQILRHPDALTFNGLVYYENPTRSADFYLHILEFHEFSSQRKRHPRFLHSGNLVIKRSLFHQTGYFRTDIPMCTDFSFFAQMPQTVLVNSHYIPELSVTHQAHYVDPQKIGEKLEQMGYWRGFVESQIPLSLQIHKKPIFRWLPQLLPLSFLAIIIWRNFRLNSSYKYRSLFAIHQLYKFSKIWAKGFWIGVNEGISKTDPRADFK